jgi:hypothetical protein
MSQRGNLLPDWKIVSWPAGDHVDSPLPRGTSRPKGHASAGFRRMTVLHYRGSGLERRPVFCAIASPLEPVLWVFVQNGAEFTSRTEFVTHGRQHRCRRCRPTTRHRAAGTHTRQSDKAESAGRHWGEPARDARRLGGHQCTRLLPDSGLMGRHNMLAPSPLRPLIPGDTRCIVHNDTSRIQLSTRLLRI